MNKRMERDKKRLVKNLLHGATIIEGEVRLIQNFIFPEVPDKIMEEIDKMVLEREKERQENKKQSSK
ncbi:hypothetical protein L604_000700000920 [Bacillus subtilis J27]|uniref:hypothetical protein n=1 Tax=Bacillus subtilis TaxID=1423 RepID=UPI0011A67446|nr:hypothetical protein [Bacillus subtilis]TWG74397.1 hypothetical protein L604_000700000920 [Bacillus subtilis J27]